MKTQKNNPDYSTTYLPPFLFNNGHIQTIYPVLFRKLNQVNYQRERIETPDGDFLDLDWLKNGHKKLVIISHGLEGNSDRAYVTGMARAFHNSSCDVLAWNFRSCSGEANRKLISYHSSFTDDLDFLINLSEERHYREIYLIGFSIGGNITLVHLGKNGDTLSGCVKKAVCISVPCDLRGSSLKLSQKVNALYMKRFLRLLRDKITAKMEIMPDLIDDKNYESIRNFKDFDDRYTAPINGFKDAEEYWEKSSSKQFLHNIKVPTLLISALDDPFLSETCYPYSEVTENPVLKMETPESGGHVGFVTFGQNQYYWSEKMSVEFCTGHQIF